MIGAIIGDIIGSRFEFKNRRSTNFELFHPDCSFTDDTICTIAVADWLMNNDGRSLADIMRQWCRKYPDPQGGYGASFRHWVFSDSGSYNSFGNGSAMRVSPCGWIKDHSTALECAIKSAEITHEHFEGIKGAMCIADLIWLLRNKKTLKEDIERTCFLTYEYEVNIDLDQLRKINKFDESCQVTVPQAIACFMQSQDFENAIRLAVSIGGDSDTIAAITGSMAEAAYGMPTEIVEKALKYLPNDMINVIENFTKYVKRQTSID